MRIEKKIKLTWFVIVALMVQTGFSQSVVLTGSTPNIINGIQTIRYTFDVTCNGIPTRTVRVNKYFQPNNSRGTILFTTGGNGGGYYSNQGTNCIITIDTVWKSGYEVCEIKWDGSNGWATNAQGKGYHIATNAYSELIKHLYQGNYFLNKDTIIAQGNSGGSFQIAYGLALYDLDTIIDMAILSGGPPVSNLKTSIFGNGTEPEYWPNGLSGFAFTDYIMGWQGNGDYCVNRVAPKVIQDMLDSVSLVSPNSFRKYNYNNTIVHFVQSNDPSAADSCGLIYHDSISSLKYWHHLLTVNTHEVHTTLLGSQKIQEIILNYTNPLTNISDIDFKITPVNIFPNPTSNGMFQIETASSSIVILSWTVYNLFGQPIVKGFENKIQLHEKGLYLINFETNKGRQTSKIIYK